MRCIKKKDKKMKDVIVIIRVYDRIEDLRYSLQIIKETWKINNYSICVVSNGQANGYSIPTDLLPSIDNPIILKNNAGHLKGNSQLLLSACNVVNFKKYDYTIILEADTWLYSDEIIIKYIERLDNSECVWASAKWYDRFHSLATDFAIIKSSFLHYNTEIFNFVDYPECYVCNYLMEKNKKYLYIKENMNVQIPSYIKRLPHAPHGRFYSFHNSKMVTHHIEHLKGGMLEKKKIFNSISNTHFFKDAGNPSLKVRYSILLSHCIDKFLVRRSWYSKVKKFEFK